MEKILKLYTLRGGVENTPFPNAENQIEIGDFRYNAIRMGGTPVITASVMYPECLDGVWDTQVYTWFNGEKYFLKQIPTSSKNNQDARYKHDLELVSERKILEDIYLYNIVDSSASGDAPMSNGTHVNFAGDIVQFVKRLNESLRYSKVGYNVVIDEGVKTNDEVVDIENEYFANAIQEIYNVFDLPYYFVGKTIHVGYSSNALPQTFKYGAEGSLLSITKQNANYKIVNRCSGFGSSDNIPYYYPNNSPKGDIRAEVQSSNPNYSVTIVDAQKYANEVALDERIEKVSVEHSVTRFVYERGYLDEVLYTPNKDITRVTKSGNVVRFYLYITAQSAGVLPIKLSGDFKDFKDADNKKVLDDLQHDVVFYGHIQEEGDRSHVHGAKKEGKDTFYFTIPKAGNYRLWLDIAPIYKGKYSTWNRIEATVNFSYTISNQKGWALGVDRKPVTLEEVGLKENGVANPNDSITQRLVRFVNTSDRLLPSIYRETHGAERFYNALNGTYPIPNDPEGKKYAFNNPFVEGFPKEHIIDVPEIRPSIKGVTNGATLPIDIFSEFAYDRDDNNETEEIDGEVVWKHPYFFGKLRKTDGANGFNLFDCASEQGEMRVSMTSGHCSACEFVIAVDKDESKYNLVQVDEVTNELMRDEDGNVICGREHYQSEVERQEWQQDTRKREVWVALRKDTDTYGVTLPDKTKGIYPLAQSDVSGSQKADTFVLLNINLPQGYVTRAEEWLKEEIIAYMSENNDDKFNFSIDFSRIYLEEHPEVLSHLDENARLTIEYDNKRYELYVKSYSYTMAKNAPLPNIRVDLCDTLETPTSAMQNAINTIESKVGQTLANIDVVGSASPYFLRKDLEDTAQEIINFAKGIKFGKHGEVSVDEKDGTKAVFDYIEVKKKATFTSLEVQHKTHVDGQMLVTPASMVCSYVEEQGESYRCYFETEGDGTNHIFNTFAIGDLAICQTFNETASKYYWREVVGIGEDYIDLSKTICDTSVPNDIPSEGDNIIQLGCKSDVDRQSAIMISSYGEHSPSFVVFNGINGFSLNDKAIYGMEYDRASKEPKFYSYGSMFFGDKDLTDSKSTFITFQKKEGDTRKKLFIQADVSLGDGSKGLSNLSEFKQVSQKTDNNSQSIESINGSITKINSDIVSINNKLDGVVENFFQAGVPHPQLDKDGNVEPNRNYPADGTGGEPWVDANHIGDTYTNTQTIEQNPDFAGKSWRWVSRDKVGGAPDEQEYYWTLVADTDALKALQEAREAKALAGTKSKTFVTGDTALIKNYLKGDLWILPNSTIHAPNKEGEILSASKDNTTYTASDWVKSVRYTDDTRANEAYEHVGTEIEKVKEIYDPEILKFNERTDGVVFSWFYKGKPSANTYPANQWSDTQKTYHNGDTYTNIEPYSENNKNGGKSWKWNGSSWDVLVSESDAAKALNEIVVTNGNVEKKSTTFVASDTSKIVNYKKGDLWILPNSTVHTPNKQGDILTASQDSATYVASHWVKSVRYTDDSTVRNFIDVTYKTDKNNFNNQLDKKIETWFDTKDPNKNWGIEHKGDMWYNSNTKELKQFVLKGDGTYGWELIQDQKAIAAYDDAQTAQGTANKKVQIFVGESKDIKDYKAKDLWILPRDLTVNGIAYKQGFVLIAKKGNTDFVASDWENKLAFTDDTKALEQKQRIDDIASDDKLTPSEKQELKREWMVIYGTNGTDGEYYSIYESALSYVDIDTTPFTNAYIALNDFISPLLADLNATSEQAKLGETLRGLFQQYAYQKTELQNAMSNYSKDRFANDVDYLNDIFPNANFVSEGAILSKILGVKDTSGNVVAMLNGTNQGQDATHGKLMIATGMQSVTNPNSAKTKMYQDGHIKTTSGEFEGTVVAKKGKIGEFSINESDGWLKSERTTYYENEYEQKIKSKFGSVISPLKLSTYFNEYDVYGDNTANMASTMMSDDSDHHIPATPNFSALNRFNEQRQVEEGEQKIGYFAEVDGIDPNFDTFFDPIEYSNGSYAFYARKGMFAGLRPVVRVLRNDTTLSKLDHTLIIQGTLTINLPTYPENGQRYEIWQEGAFFFSMQTTDGREIWNVGKSSATSLPFDNKARMVFVTYSSELSKWLVMSFNNM